MQCEVAGRCPAGTNVVRFKLRTESYTTDITGFAGCTSGYPVCSPDETGGTRLLVI